MNDEHVWYDADGPIKEEWEEYDRAASFVAILLTVVYLALGAVLLYHNVPLITK